MNASDVVNQARFYLGVPFKHQGRHKNGLDCIGLIVRVVTDLGMQVIDKTDYSIKPDPHEMESHLNKYLVSIPVDKMQPGCIVWMKFLKEPQHVAIITPVGLIHSYNRIGRVVEHGIDRVWNRRIVKAYRIAGVNYE